MSQPVYALVCSEEQAEMLHAALARYLVYLEEHEDPVIRELIPHVEEIRQVIIQEVHSPTIPYVDVKALGMLSQMNHARHMSVGPDVQRAHKLFAMAHSWLTAIQSIPVYFNERDNAWHFGREEAPPSLACPSPLETAARRQVKGVEQSTVLIDIATRKPL
jgi:hypothetical protein